jgi:hypothetical protein
MSYPRLLMSDQMQQLSPVRVSDLSLCNLMPTFDAYSSSFRNHAGTAVSNASSSEYFSEDGWNYSSPSTTPPATPSQTHMFAAPGHHSPAISSAPYSSPRQDYASYAGSFPVETSAYMSNQQPLLWRSYPSPLLSEVLGIDFIKECTQHLPMDAGHWTLLRQLIVAGNIDILHYLLKSCLKHEDPSELQSRPQNAVRNVGGYLTKVIRQKTQLLQRRPDIVEMMNQLSSSSPALAAQVDGRILQLLSESLQSAEGVSACQSFMSLPASRGSAVTASGGQNSASAALQNDLKCYVGHAAWVDDLLTCNDAGDCPAAVDWGMQLNRG